MWLGFCCFDMGYFTVDIIIGSLWDWTLRSKISEAITVFLHVLPVLRDGQPDEPYKVYQQKRPIHRN